MLKQITYTMPILLQDIGMMLPSINSSQKYRYGLYKCSCGLEFKAMTANIKSGMTKSCGCYKITSCTTHGMTRHRLYHIWHNMINRIYNPKNKYFKNYGERGITICNRWKELKNFIEDMYPTYQEGLSIDRINNDGNYEPSNCRWATKEVQARNTRILKSTNKSGYRGVYWNKIEKKWVCQIKINGKQKHLGYFNTPLEASKVYDQYVIENNLEHTINGANK